MTFDATDLVNSFRAAGAWIDDGAMDLVPVPGMGMGAVAKRRIEVSKQLQHSADSFSLTLPSSTSPSTTSCRHGRRTCATS